MTPERIGLKRATGEMLKGVGGLEAAAGFTRVGRSTLGDYQLLSQVTSFVPLDVVADLEPLARDREGWPHVTRALCAHMGGTFVPLPDVPSCTDAMGMLARQTQEHSDVVTALVAGMADGKLCASDARKITKELDELIAAAAGMRACMQTIAGGAE